MCTAVFIAVGCWFSTCHGVRIFLFSGLFSVATIYYSQFLGYEWKTIVLVSVHVLIFAVISLEICTMIPILRPFYSLN